MDKKQILASLGLIIIAAGFAWIGTSIKSLRQDNIVDVTGSAEKIIKMNAATLHIIIDNKGENISDLYKKRVNDRNKVMKFLEEQGISDKTDHIDIATINSPQGEIKRHWLNNVSRDKNLTSTDTITIYSKNITAVKNIVSQIDNLSSDNIIVTAKCKYHIDDESSLRNELIKEAAKEALNVATEIVSPFKKRITGIKTISHQKIAFLPLSASKHDHYYYSEEEGDSATKKATLQINVKFFHD
ncbi:MAG: DUF541 domain-containing protein [Alphaproteobacteria bacterium]|nr:DUF541 domain-containing protein [Alphaproteobacteria bacterium]